MHIFCNKEAVTSVSYKIPMLNVKQTGCCQPHLHKCEANNTTDNHSDSSKQYQSITLINYTGSHAYNQIKTGSSQHSSMAGAYIAWSKTTNSITSATSVNYY